MNITNKAIEFLSKNNITVYKEHIPFVNEYRAFFNMNDDNYTKEQVFVNRSGGEHLHKEAAQKVRYITNIHLSPCKEFAKLLFNEKVDFKSDDEITNQINVLRKYYTDKKVWLMLEQNMIEIFGTGTLGIMNSYDNFYGIQHIPFSADRILPISIVNNEIKECVFVAENEMDKTILLYKHTVNKDEHVKSTTNKKNKNRLGQVAYKVEIIKLNENGIQIPYDENNDTKIIDSAVKQFIIIKPFNVGSIYHSNAFGMPIYWKYLFYVKSIDKISYIQDKDIDLSQKQAFVDESLLDDGFGNYIVPNAFTTAFITKFNSSTNNSSEHEKFFEVYSPIPNSEVYDKAIEYKVKSFSREMGLGSSGLSIDKISAKTATQIISENAEKFSTLKKHYSMMRDAFIDFNRAILFLLQSNENIELDYDVNIEYNVSDSIIEDDAAIEERALKEYNAGLMSARRYLSSVKGLSGDELEAELAGMAK